MNEAPLLKVEDLTVRAHSAATHRTLVDQVSFTLGAETLALVGESGSGKSMTARAILGLLRPPLQTSARELALEDQDLRACSAEQWNRLRGARLSLMLQDPRHSLNPVLTIGRQLELALRIHQRLPAAARRARIADQLAAVGLMQTRQVLRAFPHQTSGGMGQRVVLAMMLLNDPRILIADEPTSALDGALRDQVLELITGQVRSRRMGLLLISHDLQSVARHAQRVLVMHRGRIVDRCAAADLAHATHPYTRALWNCRPGPQTYGTMLPVLDPAWNIEVPAG